MFVKTNAISKMARSALLLLATLSVVVLCASCDSLFGPQKPATTGTIILNNDIQNVAVATFYIKANGSGDWGPSLLSAAVAPGKTFTKTGIAPGTYDIGFATEWLSDGYGGSFYIWGTKSAVDISAGKTFTIRANSEFDNYGSSP